jgi:hypothetical protein
MTIVSTVVLGLVLAGAGPRGAVAGASPVELTLRQGETVEVPEADLTIEVKSVSDPEKHGCLGGPIGCPGRARLRVTRGTDSQEVALVAPRLAGGTRARLAKTVIYGFKLFLTSVDGEKITLRLEKAVD